MNIEIENKINRKRIISIIVLSMLVFLFVLFTILMIVFVNKEQLLKFEIVGSIVDILLIIPIIYYSTIVIPTNKSYKKYVELMNKQNPNEVFGKVISISNDLTILVPGVKAYEVEILVEQQYKKIFLVDVFKKDYLKINESYRFQIISNFILEATK
ncbi:MAG: hypothetical protein PUG55_03340 [Bacillales bacterium]|nr:hypothetical protein [Bacillales bacterium]MDY6002855.1 hypothetical protein [Bacilli bacterium]